MDVRYEEKEKMTFIGYHTSIRMEEGYEKCPEFWNKEYAAKFAHLWQTMKPENPLEAAVLENRIGMFAICVNGEGGFDYWIAGLYQGGDVPEGLELYTFPAGDWAVFTAKGPIPESLQALNTEVWEEWIPRNGQKYQADTKATLEVYAAGDNRSADYESGIWIPIMGE